MQMEKSTVIERKGVIYISNYDLQDFNDKVLLRLKSQYTGMVY